MQEWGSRKEQATSETAMTSVNDMKDGDCDFLQPYISAQAANPIATQTALDAHDDHDLRVPYYCEENVWRLAYRRMSMFGLERGECVPAVSAAAAAVTSQGDGDDGDTTEHPLPIRSVRLASLSVALKRPIRQAPNSSSSSTTTKDAVWWVVWISNPAQQVVMLHQRAGVHGAMGRTASAAAACWDYHVILIGAWTCSPTECAADAATRTASIVARSSLSGPLVDDPNPLRHADVTRPSNVTAGTQRRRLNNVYVYDIDTLLQPYPCPFVDYVRHSFPTWTEQQQQHRYSSSQSSSSSSSSPPPLFRVVPARDYVTQFASDRLHMFQVATQTWNAPPPTYPCLQAAATVSRLASSTIRNRSSSTTTRTDARMTTATRSNFHHYLNFHPSQHQQQQYFSCSDDKAINRGSILTLQELLDFDFFANTSTH